MITDLTDCIFQKALITVDLCDVLAVAASSWDLSADTVLISFEPIAHPT